MRTGRILHLLAATVLAGLLLANVCTAWAGCPLHAPLLDAITDPSPAGPVAVLNDLRFWLIFGLVALGGYVSIRGDRDASSDGHKR